MQIQQKQWTEESGWRDLRPPLANQPVHIVLVFGATALVKKQKHLAEIKSFFPGARIIICSTAGEITRSEVRDNSIVATAVTFSQTTIQCTIAKINSRENSFAIGKKLASCLSTTDLIHVMVFAEGLLTNGTQLVAGLTGVLPKTVRLTGGLVGDGTAFKETVVGLDVLPESGNIVLIGFYGKHLKVGYGSLGGWDTFGLDRVITKSTDNVLYELDGKPALELYKTYLGPKAQDLPSSGLLFPLSLELTTPQGQPIEIVRTILSVDETNQSITFAGDMPERTRVKLMKANFERLIDGAAGAAGKSIEHLGSAKAQLAILISCIGRKLVLKERVNEEIEAVGEITGTDCTITGFYSYGEIAPGISGENQCQLHNQTMTITTFNEV